MSHDEPAGPNRGALATPEHAGAAASGGPTAPHAPPAVAPAPFGPPKRWRLAWWLWFAVLFGLSSIPGDRMGPQPFEWFDKVEHAGFFFLGGLVLGGWLAAGAHWPARWWLLPLVAGLVGGFDEAHQLLTPGRSGLDPGDWIADVLGGSLAAAAVHVGHRRRQPPRGQCQGE